MGLRRALAAAALLWLAGPAFARPLDGTAWKLRVDQKGLPNGFWSSDLLVFDQGLFAAVEALAAGFAPKPYESRAEPGRTRWWSSQAGPGGQTLVWSGVLEGRRMSGVMRLESEDAPPWELRWTAVPRPRPAAVPGFR
ncbi:MAG: hypothetical protein HY554_09320 [Elusimicrobia bacterium]|nr:hypothetical protein [Elusimicrobiota bacterium]